MMMPDEVRKSPKPSTRTLHGLEQGLVSLTVSSFLGHATIYWSPFVTIYNVYIMYITLQDKPTPKRAPAPPRPPPLPTVDGKSGQLDVVSRLLKDRILLLGTEVNDEMANVLVAQLLYLANEDPNKDITIYINSPGGMYDINLYFSSTMGRCNDFCLAARIVLTIPLFFACPI
jgi:Clp protease